MTTDQINYVNIGLMAVSVLAAFILPFEVFLFSYAVFGPLHYLTEISWLHDRQYFSPKKFDWIPLTVLGLLILMGANQVMGEGIVGLFESIGLKPMLQFCSEYAYDITFMAFGLALIFVLIKDSALRIGAIIVLVLAAYIFHIPDSPDPKKMLDKFSNPYWKAFAVYLPTLLHVYVFTGAFMIFGALKRNSRTGYIAFGFFILCALACFFLLPETAGFAASDWAMTNYAETFKGLSHHMLDDVGGMKLTEVARVDLFTNTASIVIARFIAFAYTYHYLNWFSKTSIIRWHKVPKLRFAIVIIAWIASVALYFYDYTIGFRWLFLLSFLHVLLEFPLNHHSFIGIGKELYGKISGKTTAPASKSGA